MKFCASKKQHRTVAILVQFFALLLLSAWVSAVHARNMELTISATPDPAVAGEELIYTVAYRNSGSACPKASLHFTLPQHIGSASGTTRSWSLGTLPGGRHGSRTVRVKVDSPLAPNTELKTTANVTSTGAVRCQTTVNDDTNVRPALLVTKTSSAGTVEAGEELVYTLHYDNAGKGNATNVILKDTLPANVSFVSATGTHSESGNIVTWNLGTVVAGAKGSVTLTVAVSGQIANGTILTNSGTIDSTETDPSPFSLDVSVHSEPVLWLTKTASKDLVSPGDHLVYTLHYENSGTDVATNLVVRDTLPAGVTFDTAPGGSLSGNIVSWNLADLPPNTSGKLTLAVIVDSDVVNGHVLENSAILDSDETQPVTALKDVVVLAEPAFEISKTASKDPVKPGDELTYTIEYGNIGNGGATGIVIEDDLPTGVTFISASPGFSHAGQVVTWNLAALSAGVKGSVTVTVKVGDSLSNGTILLNTVSIESTETAPHKVHAVDDVIVHSRPVLELTKTSSRNPVKAGEQLVYTIAYTNVGTGTATGVTLEDDLPTGATFISASTGSSHVGGKVSWTLPDIPVNAKGSVHVTVTVDSSVPDQTVLHNVATINSAETQPLSDFDDVTVSSTAALKLTKTANKDWVNPSDEITYTLAYENVGTATANGVSLADAVPLHTKFKGASNRGAIDPLVPGLVKWNLGTLVAGGKGSVTLTVTVDHPLADGISLANHATIVSIETPHRVQAEAIVFVVSEPVLELNKMVTGTQAHFKPGEQVTYQIEYKNVGTGAATGVIVTDTLPGDVTFSYAIPTPTTNSNGVISWSLPVDVTAGAKPEYIILGVTINSPLTDGTVVLNPASIRSNETAPVSSSVDITVLSEPALELTKTPSATQVTPGDFLTYTIEYRNAGTDEATGVKLEDHLPGNVTFVSASGSYTESNGIVSWDLGSIPAGAAAGSVFVKVKVNFPITDGTVVQNPASIHSNETQPVSTIANITVLSHPRLGLIKTAARDHVKPGEELVYTIEYQNSGTDQATLVTLEDHIPGDVTFVSATGNPVVSNGIVHWDIGTMPAGAAAGSVTVKVRINDPLPNGTVVHNPASIKGKNASSVTSEAPVSVISAPVLKLTKKASADPVLPGDTLVYTLEYSNEGTDLATGVILTDTLPGEVTFVSASGNGTESNGIVSWDLGDIQAWGTPGSISVKVKVNSPLNNGTKLHNVASIHSNEVPAVTALIEGIVHSTPVLELTKAPSATQVSPGDSLTYTIEYKNAGTDVATGVKLEDHLPGNVTFVSASGGGIESNGIVSWDLGSIPAGAAAGSVFVKVKVNSPIVDGTVVQNPASIHSNETQPVSTIADVTVLSHPRLGLIKTAARDHVNPGEELVYTIEYQNSGTDQATLVTLEDHIPGDVTFISATGNPVVSNGIVHWDIGTLPAGTAAGSVTVRVRINDPLPNGTVIHNPASIQGAGVAPVTSQALVSVISAPVLKLTKKASTDPVLPGDTLVYTLEYSNEGTDLATGVILTDTLPGEVTFVSASGNGTESNGIVSWDLGDIQAWGTPGSVSVKVKVNSPLNNGTKLHNVASIHSNEVPAVTVLVEVVAHSTPVLKLHKTVPVTHVMPGDTLTYKLEYANTGTDEATGVKLEDHLPGNVTFVSASGTNTESGGIVSWDLSSISAGQTGSETVTVKVNSPLTNGIILHNPATLESTETQPVKSEVDVTVDSTPVLQLSKTASAVTVEPDDTLTYTLAYENTGNAEATGVILEDDLPAGVTFVSATQSGVYSPGKVIWNLGVLPSGASGTVDIIVTINTSVADGTVLHNAATIHSTETQPVSTQMGVTVLVASVVLAPATPVPALGTLMLLMLSLLLLAIGAYSVRRQKA